MEIHTSDTYDEDGGSIAGGLMDHRLGTLEPRQRCRTCGNISINCPGHYGHIELAVPVIHVEFAKHIYKLLSVTCRSCGRILLSPEDYEVFQSMRGEEKRLFGKISVETTKEIVKQAKKKKKFKECPMCGMVQSNVKFAKPTSFLDIEQEELDTGESLMEEISRRLTPNMIREWFERIPDDDLELLDFDPGVARPEWMILQVLPVPPVDVRPSIILESGIRAEDDLTHKLVDIIRINQRLRENIGAGAPTLIIEDLSELLQYHITTYFNNEVSGIPPARHRSGRTLKSLAQRLKGKEGRFRGNLSGKRVDYSARTVISPDPNLDINEVGVPVHIAMRLTVPDMVTERNKEEMRKLVLNGPSRHPGALYAVRPDAKRIRLEFVTDKSIVADSLEPGFVIERHLKDGDIALFNRQPSLHRMSIMAHRVKVLPYRTFRMHLAVCPPYNADFDGDEMNLHIPQSKEAQTEARLLMQVQDQILSPRYGAPIIGATKDFITGAYLLTRKQTMLTADEVGKLLAATGYTGPEPEPSVTEPEPMWSGKDIFSLYLPEDFNYVIRANICNHCKTCEREKCPYDAYVTIREGKLLTGVIDKNTIGAERAGTIFHRVIKDYGTDAGHDFLNSVTKLINDFLSFMGFTFSVEELTIGPSEKSEINRVMKRMERNVDKLIVELNTGELERLPGQSLRETFEIQVMNELAKARDRAGETVESQLEMDNAGIIMTRSGARGSSLNIGQMMGSVGQQAIRGKRIMRGYMNRTLPHYNKHDPTPEARGFVYNCYRDGLTPIEFFFHAMGGREGLVDTAVRTQQSGYMQRRLINALEHLRVEYDGTVRDSSGNIVQFTYGEDGVDPAKSDHGKAVDVGLLIERVKIAMPKGRATTEKYIEGQLSEMADILTPSLIDELRKNLAASKMTKRGVDTVIGTVARNYDFSLVEPGEAVGTIAAQSIGEPGTQMTLRTFQADRARGRQESPLDTGDEYPLGLEAQAEQGQGPGGGREDDIHGDRRRGGEGERRPQGGRRQGHPLPREDGGPQHHHRGSGECAVREAREAGQCDLQGGLLRRQGRGSGQADKADHRVPDKGNPRDQESVDHVRGRRVGDPDRRVEPRGGSRHRGRRSHEDDHQRHPRDRPDLGDRGGPERLHQGGPLGPRGAGARRGHPARDAGLGHHDQHRGDTTDRPPRHQRQEEQRLRQGGLRADDPAPGERSNKRGDRSA